MKDSFSFEPESAHLDDVQFEDVFDRKWEYEHDNEYTPPDIGPFPEEYDNYIDPYIPDDGPSR